MTRLKKMKERLDKLKSLPKHERMLELTGLLTEYYSGTKINPIIVGGLSVEIYTGQNYTTFDIDLVSDGWEEINQLLTKELHFKKSGRGWYHEELELAIDIPSKYLEGNSDKVVEVELQSGRMINVIGLEDIIIRRLESATASFPKTPEYSDDYTWALNMFFTHKEDKRLMDLDYLLEASKVAKVNHIIDHWLK